jgi:hypothetical protein
MIGCPAASAGDDRIEAAAEIGRVEQLYLDGAEDEVVILPNWSEGEAVLVLLGAVSPQRGNWLREQFDDAAGGGCPRLLDDRGLDR